MTGFNWNPSSDPSCWWAYWALCRQACKICFALCFNFCVGSLDILLQFVKIYYSSFQIPKDQTIIDLITAKCDLSDLDQGAMSTSLTLDENHLDQLSEEYLQHWPLTLHLLSSNPKIQVLPPVTQSSSYPSAEGSSSSSNPSNDCPLFDLNSDYINLHGFVKQSIGQSSGSKKNKHNESSLKRQADLVSHCGNMVENDEGNVIQKPVRRFHSKNLVTERKRRNRIKDGLFTLRSLVPKITKVKMIDICQILLGLIHCSLFSIFIRFLFCFT